MIIDLFRLQYFYSNLRLPDDYLTLLNNDLFTVLYKNEHFWDLVLGKYALNTINTETHTLSYIASIKHIRSIR